MKKDPVKYLVERGLSEDIATDMVVHDLLRDTPTACRVCTDCGCGECCFTDIG